LIALFKDLGVDIKFPVTIYEDNISATLISKHSAFHQRTKHIDTRYHYIREKVEEGIVKTEHIKTEDLVADIFTKSLAALKYRDGCGLKSCR
jgi:hypothetical protein